MVSFLELCLFLNDYQLIADGDTLMLAILHSEEFKEEYEKLNEAGWDEIIAAHESNGYDYKHPTARSWVQDVTAMLQTICHLVPLCFSFFFTWNLSLKVY